MQQASTSQSPSQLPAAQAVAGGVPTLDVPLLIDIAYQSRTDTRGGDPARLFFARLVGAVETRHGSSVAASLALALGFDHLIADSERGQ